MGKSAEPKEKGGKSAKRVSGSLRVTRSPASLSLRGNPSEKQTPDIALLGPNVGPASATGDKTVSATVSSNIFIFQQ